MWLFAPLDRRLAPAPDPARVDWLRGVAFAHRGLHGPGVVENSATAFARAIAAGLGIECDVRQSGDGEAIVFHDRDLDRLTHERGAFTTRSSAELRRITLRGSGDTIPSLRELLTQVAGKAPLLLELKTERDGLASALCRAVLRDLEGYGGPHAVMSFDPRVARWFAGHAPGIVRGLVVSEADARGWRGALGRHRALWRARPDFLAYDVCDLPSAFAATQRARGLPVATWTVSTPALRERAAIHADSSIAEAEGVASGRSSP